MNHARAAGVLALALLGCGGDEAAPPEPGLFIALSPQFRDFRSWPRVAISAGDDPIDPTQPFFAYANMPPPAAGAQYPVGSILVHTVELTEDPMSWEVFAMVKRGGGYNASGARDWEFFRLGFASGDVPFIISRGFSPVDDGIYSSGPGRGCNGCHAATDAAAHDYVLSRQLRPGAAR